MELGIPDMNTSRKHVNYGLFTNCFQWHYYAYCLYGQMKCWNKDERYVVDLKLHDGDMEFIMIKIGYKKERVIIF